MYGTIEGADAYHASRGNVAWSAASEVDRLSALVRGTDYLDQRYRVLQLSGRWESMFPGTRTAGRGQEHEWPRTGAVDYDGNVIAVDEVPSEVERATYEAALRELARPGSLSPDFVASEAVTREKVGPIEVTYTDSGASGQPANRPLVPAIDEILAPLLRMPYIGPAVFVV
ncbi:hypothetical protein LL962_16890 [Xanthomonas sp. NCPPB 1067]|uniref:DnaT-like ssDNA-binding protein n=1 Tax=Xanthomonas sp. NCPPB 1067 TaxID=487524 RepID=UPI001E522E08|nr:DnaT-like ssDNA-binding protein [Xanthomonas sp. NCPPB 1067]MCC4588757.1 hypothetical protein [Xanthomonas sp. NCPPB 1067]